VRKRKKEIKKIMPFSKPVAVIDIGSNSVRLVIYDGMKRSPMQIFNERVLCGLAKDMDLTGNLNKDGVAAASLAMDRFVKLAEVMGVVEVHLFATAAVRDAKDGADFVKKINKKHNVKIQVLSGEEEAQYAGFGIISSVSEASGVVGDLGGGSLELIQIATKSVEKPKSFPIGPLRLSGEKSKSDLKKFIKDYIEQFPLKETLDGKNFYAVGGAFRNLAKVHMGRKNYPLKVIHNYKVRADEFLNTLQIVSRMSTETLQKLPGISKKRVNFLPYAALIVENIIKQGNPKHIVFVASGVREGLLYSKLKAEIKDQDPLISGCTQIMHRMIRPADYGYELAKWMQPLFDDIDEKESKLLLASCIMSEISCYENPEYRAEMAYRKILDSSLTGLSHKDRVFIAKSLYCRYSSQPDNSILSLMQPLLSSKKIQDAQVIGAAMRLARSLSGSCIGILGNTKLKRGKKKLSLEINDNFAELQGESIRKRVKQLGEVMGLKGELV
jgi:exopolyphosphatase/guanosine-5'-triphosphate,3'-diphosphate pyrophosphatase